jgi:hypothetical protein
MTPEELARSKVASAADPDARRAQATAAEQLGVTLFQRDGIVTRAELKAAGLTRSDIDRLLRHNSLRRVHRLVYVDHTGPLTRDQRIWAAVLALAPAVVCGRTLLFPEAGTDADPVDIAIDWRRRVTVPAGVRLHRVRDLEALAQWKAEPPRMRREDAALMLVDRAATELDVVRLLTDAARDRNIGVERLRQAAQRRGRLRRRAFVVALLDDIAGGVQSVLEYGYLSRVERAHGLPAASRQVLRRTAGGKQYRDLEYEEFGLVVELDGRLNHDSFDAESRDAERDLADQASGRAVTRLRWRQVFGTPCHTAAQIATLLQQRGWEGSPRPCGPSCPLSRR